jgi:triosephosphate isomerase
MEWKNYLAVGVPPARRALIGGNWKCNGTVKKVNEMVATLNNGGAFPLESEVRLLIVHVVVVLFVLKIFFSPRRL